MERAYSSMLSKSVLAYNIAYHIGDIRDPADAQKVIISLLETFEYREPTTEEKQE